MLSPPRASRKFLTLDLALVAALSFVALQIVPLPAAVRSLLSPSAARVESELRFALQGVNRPLSLDAGSSAAAAALAVMSVLLFWSARAMLAAGGFRQTCRWIARFGLAASAIAVTQHATAPRMIYWIWPPASPSARPFSPFVNRNDLATWLVLAIPLTVGYLLTRLESRRQGRGFDAQAVDATTVWLGGSVAAMAIALLTTASRSGLSGASAAAVLFLLLSRRRIERKGQITLVASGAAVALIAAVYVNTADLMARIDETLAAGVGGRREIWAATWPMIRDFPVTGVGVGAYARAMSVYQPPQHLFAFNHAHSEYLQIVAEGGLVLSAIVLAAILAGGVRIAQQLRRDTTPMWWTRAGAACGLAAVAVQSLWETGLRMPANAVLLAIGAAIAIHDRPRSE